MRNSNLTLKLACYLIVAALLVWLGIYAYQALNDPYRTVPVTSLNIRDSVEVRGIVAREGQGLDGVYSSVRVNLSEGTRVAAGGRGSHAAGRAPGRAPGRGGGADRPPGRRGRGKHPADGQRDPVRHPEAQAKRLRTGFRRGGGRQPDPADPGLRRLQQPRRRTAASAGDRRRDHQPGTGADRP